MNEAGSVLLSYVVNSLWQIPLIAAAAWTAARLLRAMGPGAEHRVWVTALVLEGAVPGLSVARWEWVHLGWPWRAHATQAADGSVSVGMGAGSALAGLQIPGAIATALGIAYLAATGYCVIRFAWHWIRLSGLSRSVNPVVADGVRERWSDCFQAGRVVLASSEEVFAPVTMGIIKKSVVLPEGMIHRLSRRDLDTAIAHEMAHVRRNDFAKNLVYEIGSLAVNYHPAVWFTRQQVTETREMVCDEMAAKEAGSQVYAQSLLRLASLLLEGKPVGVPHAIGVFDSNTLERRLMKVTEAKREVGRVRRIGLTAACTLLGLMTAASALALRIGVDQRDSGDKALSKSIPSSVPAKVMQDHLITKIPPVYPPEAKKARIQGKVLLEAVIGVDGHVENLKVISGPNELQQSALDAVRQWVYKPYLVNGNPVEVTTQITVNYTLKK